jgi:hypothetical protein
MLIDVLHEESSRKNRGQYKTGMAAGPLSDRGLPYTQVNYIVTVRTNSKAIIAGSYSCG